MKTIAMIGLYNPGSVGMRYVGASLKAAGHKVFIINFKEFRASSIPSDDRETLEKFNTGKIHVVSQPHPGQNYFAPFPTPITENENQLLINELKNKIKPDLIAFSFFAVTAEIAKELTELIHKEIPGIPVMWGGLYCICDPEESIKTADIVCTGEGEDAAVELADRFEEYLGKGSLDINGLWFREKNGNIVRNPSTPPIDDLDRLPHPVFCENEIVIDDDAVYRDINKPEDLPNPTLYYINIFSSRGCPYKCSYCIHSVLRKCGFNKVRRRSVDNVMGEIGDRVKRFGLKHVILHDEIFCLDKNWVREFTESFRKLFHEPYGTTYVGYVHPLTTTREILDKMVSSGMTETGFGVQSGSEYVNKEIFDRPFCPEETIKLANLLQEYDFDTIGVDIIVNNPFEKEEHRKETLEFLLQIPPPFAIQPFALTVYEHSELAKKDLQPLKMDEKELLFYNMLYHLPGLTIISHEVIRELSNDPYLRRNPEILEKITIDLVNTERKLKNTAIELKNRTAETESMKYKLKLEDSQLYSFKSAVKRKVKKLLYPLLHLF